MGEDPSRIRHQIEETRSQMGETVDALAYKADVKERAKDSIADKKDRAVETFSGAKDRIVSTAPDSEQVKQGAQQAASVAQENPIGLAIGGVAVGFLVGMALPTTRVEDQRLGPLADQAKEKAREAGEEAMERGRTVVQETAQTAREKTQEQAQGLGESAQEKAQQAVQA